MVRLEKITGLTPLWIRTETICYEDIRATPPFYLSGHANPAKMLELTLLNKLVWKLSAAKTSGLRPRFISLDMQILRRCWN